MKVCLVIGDPISHSLSPKMHNAGYEYLGIEEEYCYSTSLVNLKNLKNSLKQFKDQGVRGISCTYPVKEALLGLLDELDETAELVGAVNTIVNDGGRFKGFNTDWLGVVRPFEECGVKFSENKIAVIGTGGAAKAACFGINKLGGTPVIFGRNKTEGVVLADKFNGEFVNLTNISQIQNFKAIFNATTLGMAPDNLEESPIPKQFLHNNMIIFDSIYNPRETLLLKTARKAGAKTINGIEMLLHQGLEQFRLFTGFEPPLEIMRNALKEI